MCRAPIDHRVGWSVLRTKSQKLFQRERATGLAIAIVNALAVGDVPAPAGPAATEDGLAVDRGSGDADANGTPRGTGAVQPQHPLMNSLAPAADAQVRAEGAAPAERRPLDHRGVVYVARVSAGVLPAGGVHCRLSAPAVSSPAVWV